MTEIISRPCCESHRDWPELTQHLIDRFPEVPLEDVVGIINRTRRAEADFALLEGDRLVMAEVIVRHQLLQLSGLEPTVLRLDAQSHRRGDPTPQPT